MLRWYFILFFLVVITFWQCYNKPWSLSYSVLGQGILTSRAPGRFCDIVSHMYCNDNNFGRGGGGRGSFYPSNTLDRTLPVWGFAEGFKLELWNLRRCDAGQRMLFDWNPSENFSEKALLNMRAICLVKRGERLTADCILVPEIRSWNTLQEILKPRTAWSLCGSTKSVKKQTKDSSDQFRSKRKTPSIQQNHHHCSAYSPGEIN